jgi:pyruvate formate lyase activating enzyme
MMACSFCQNWKTSQIQHLDYQSVRHYTPEQLIELCLENDIPIISWTYNDPVVWHEFVVETSGLAHKNGIKTLYKSAFYIEEEPVKELIECIDIFSLSLKSLDEKFYQKETKATLKPVLERIKQVAISDRHLEISQLVIPELNDGDKDINQTIDWLIDNVGNHVPLHFVAFHPAYKYTHVERTQTATLKHARSIAKAKGIQHVYLGNTYEENSNDTYCHNCNAKLVTRYGLHSQVSDLDENSCCSQCGAQSPIIDPFLGTRPKKTSFTNNQDLKHKFEILWDNEYQSVHIIQVQGNGKKDSIRIRSLGNNKIVEKELAAGLDRFIVSRQSNEEKGIVISWDSSCIYQNLAVLDRAHYPVLPNEQLISVASIK